MTLEEALLQALLGFGFRDGSGSGCGAGGGREEQQRQQQDQWAPHGWAGGAAGRGRGVGGRWVVRGHALCLPASTGLAPHSQVCHRSPARRPERFSPVELMRLSAQAELHC